MTALYRELCATIGSDSNYTGYNSYVPDKPSYSSKLPPRGVVFTSDHMQQERCVALEHRRVCALGLEKNPLLDPVV
jgi:hypothetical protein